jgi:hypothetical protein
MLYQLIQYLVEVWEWLIRKTQFFAGETAGADISLSLGTMLIILALLTVCMGSAFWAGSVAASRKHNLWLHALIGLVAPLVYPAIIMFTLDLKGAKEREQSKVEQEAAAKAEQAERDRLAQVIGRSPGEEDEEAEAAAVSYDRDYFKKIARNESGQLTGPWMISYNNQSVCALHIVDCLDEVLVIEIEIPSGDRQRIRIRYALIQGCEHA